MPSVKELIPFDYEHIYSKNRSINNAALREKIGNKALLEKNINIRASDYRFEDKRKYYTGYTTASGIVKNGTRNLELRTMAAELKDFDVNSIKERNEKITKAFVKFVNDNGF